MSCYGFWHSWITHFFCFSENGRYQVYIITRNTLIHWLTHFSVSVKMVDSKFILLQETHLNKTSFFFSKSLHFQYQKFNQSRKPSQLLFLFSWKSGIYEGSSISLYPNYEGLVIEQWNLEGSKCIITERSMWGFGNIQWEVRTREHFTWKQLLNEWRMSFSSQNIVKDGTLGISFCD